LWLSDRFLWFSLPLEADSDYHAAMKRIYTSVYPFLLLIVSLSLTAPAQQKKTVVVAPPVGTGAVDGKSLYLEFCAVCHGKDGKGAGPVASALKTPATDLTHLAKTNGGRFSETKVMAILNGDASAAAHGNREMPIWGKAFGEMSPNLSVAQGRKHALIAYLESIQAK
jgi:mono/diheme cytochrome c family protein